ncbi:MAG: SMC family ATPase [Aeromicrobium sp.]|uniref:AAA family ATPase n=1 Tax=Aeromicrobium sp. TaxID=1871063 RepID=UPI0039E627EB
MRIHAVEMTGFGPFRETARVDFDAFADDGVFLIGGRTGAGKSSVLDALTFGLFGSVPRYGGKADVHVRSRYLGPDEPTTVTVEFTVAQARYRARRSPSWDAPKARGTGFTRKAAQLELCRWADGDWQTIETKLGNAEIHVQQLLGLNADQFLQVVLLAQGRFQEFLVAKSEERRALLRTLFRTERFERYAAEMQDRARTVKAEVEQAEAVLATIIAAFARQARVDDPPQGTSAAPWASEIVAAHAAEVEQAQARVTETGDLLTTAEAAWQRARTTDERQQRRAHALARREELAAEHDLIEVHRAAVATARRAEPAYPAVTAQASAAARLEEARAALAGLPYAETDAEVLRVREQEFAHRLGALSGAVESERRLPTLQREAQAAEQALTEIDRATQEHLAERSTARDEVTRISAEITALGDCGADHLAAENTVARLRERLAAARRAADETAALTEAENRHLRLSEAAHQAESAWLDLRRRQLAGWASTVAAELADGEPCPVCGAPDHPRPATPGDDHVRAESVEAAEQAHAAARAQESDAKAEVEALRATLKATVEAAGGSTQELTAALGDAEAALATAAEAVTRRSALEAERTRFGERIDTLDADLATAAERREAAAAHATTCADALANALAAVAEARGDAPSAQARRDALQAEHEELRRVIALIETVRQRREAQAEAEQALTESLRDTGFASAAEVRAARLPAAEIGRLDGLVIAHDQDGAVVASVLSDPELADLPVDPVDLEAPAAAVEDARGAHEAATSDLATRQARLAALSDLAERITETIEASADLIARHGTVADLDLALRGLGANARRMPLETFALAAELTDILDAANIRLTAMTKGRYQLQHSDTVNTQGRSGLDLTVLDAHTGDARAPASLSGGEKFQASLALALGLAEVVTSRAGGLRLDTLFIDEGFGALDPQTLEVTMETINELREGGRTIGLISHVEAMKEQIPAQVRILVNQDGSSTIRQDTALVNAGAVTSDG